MTTKTSAAAAKAAPKTSAKSAAKPAVRTAAAKPAAKPAVRKPSASAASKPAVRKPAAKPAAVAAATESKKPKKYVLLSGIDDAEFCQRVSDRMDQGYELYGSPAITFNGKNNIVCQALVLKKGKKRK